jgi:hypothetical protein
MAEELGQEMALETAEALEQAAQRALVKALELQVQELELELQTLKELELVRVESEKAQALAQRKAMEWDLG